MSRHEPSPHGDWTRRGELGLVSVGARADFGYLALPLQCPELTLGLAVRGDDWISRGRSEVFLDSAGRLSEGALYLVRGVRLLRLARTLCFELRVIAQLAVLLLNLALE